MVSADFTGAKSSFLQEWSLRDFVISENIANSRFLTDLKQTHSHMANFFHVRVMDNILHVRFIHHACLCARRILNA